nr:MAG TPA: hypothetical protein [Caudoviricetes sp.]
MFLLFVLSFFSCCSLFVYHQKDFYFPSFDTTILTHLVLCVNTFL